MLAGTDEVAGKAFGAFVVVDDDFVEVLNSFELFVTLFIKSAWTVSDSMFVNDGDGEVEIVPEAVGMVGSRNGSHDQRTSIFHNGGYRLGRNRGSSRGQGRF